MGLTKRLEIKIFLSFFLLYLFFIKWIGSNEYSRIFLTKSIVDENRFTIDSFFNLTVDRSFYNGHYFSAKEPMTSFLAIPIYSLWKFIYNLFPHDFVQKYSGTDEYFKFIVNKRNDYIVEPINPGLFNLMSMILVTIFTSSLFSSLTLLLIYKFVKKMEKKEYKALFVTFIAALATPIFPYSQVFFDTATTIFFSFFSFYIIFKTKYEKSNRNKNLFLAGIFSGIALSSHILSLIISIFCLIYAFLTRKYNIFPFLIGIFVGISPLLIYNFSILGTPFYLVRFHIDPIWEIHSNEDLFDPRIYVLGFYRLTFDSYKGLFFYYPVLFLFFVGTYELFRNYKLESVLLLILLFTFIFILSGIGIWAAEGICFGSRSLALISPFLVVPLISIFQKQSKKIKLVTILLFLYSTFINFTSLQPIKEPQNNYTESFIHENIRTFEFLDNPIYNYYVPLFFSKGPRSRLFEDISNGMIPDIRFFGPEKREFYDKFYFYIPFLSLLPIFLFLILIWWENIITKNVKKFILKNKWKIFSSTLSLIFLISFFIILNLPTKLTFYKGWFPEENGENWMGKTGTLIIYNKESEKKVVLSFYSKSYMKDRNIQFYLNDVLMDNFTIFIELSNFSTHEITLKPGLNLLKFIAIDGCDIPNIVEGIKDYRCLSIALSNISLNSISDKQLIFIKQNFYLPENDIFWMKQDGKILIFNPENVSKEVVLQFNAKSYYKERNLTLSLNDKVIDSFEVFKEEISFAIPLNLFSGENTLTLHSQEDCTVVADIEKNNDFRCLSVGIFNISIMSINKSQNYIPIFNKGWYLTTKDNLRIMKNKATVIIINNEKNSSTKLISIYLKSLHKDRKIRIIFNEERSWQLYAFKEGSYITLPISLHFGINTLEFLSDTCDIPSIQDKRCVSIGVENLEIKDINTKEMLILPLINWYDKDPKEDVRWMKNGGSILLFNSKNETTKFKIHLYLKSFYKDRKVLLYLNNKLVDEIYVFKEGSDIYTPLLELPIGENILVLESLDNCDVVSEFDKRCLSIGFKKVSIINYDEIFNRTMIIYNKNWYDKDPKEDVRWMKNNATLSIFNFNSEPKNTTFYFYFVPFFEKKTVHFFLNEEEKNIFNILVEGEVYTKELTLKPGENILRFYSEEECVEIAKLAKNNDYRCVTVGIKYINLK